MSQRKVHIIIWMLLISSGVFFTLTFLEHREQQATNLQKEKLERGLLMTFPFQQEGLISSLRPISSTKAVEQYVPEANYTAFILLTPTVCTGCILETHEWISFLKDFEGVKVEPALVILENDSTAAHTFFQKTQFNELAWWGLNSVTEQITSIAEDIPNMGQLLVFIDNKQGKIMRRYIIPSRVTSLNTKQILMDQVFARSTDNK